jgi:dihydrofolate reductase
VEPGAKRGPILEAAQTLPGGQQRVLQGVLGVVERSEHPVAVHLQLTVIWPARTGALADRLDRIRKYVVSATFEEPAWTNTAVIQDDPVTQVVTLMQQIGGEIVVPASFELVRTLFAHDLVDELRIMFYPVILGTGMPFFGRISDQVSLRLLANRTLGDHLTQTAYEIVRPG